MSSETQCFLNRINLEMSLNLLGGSLQLGSFQGQKKRKSYLENAYSQQKQTFDINNQQAQMKASKITHTSCPKDFNQENTADSLKEFFQIKKKNQKAKQKDHLRGFQRAISFKQKLHESLDVANEKSHKNSKANHQQKIFFQTNPFFTPTKNLQKQQQTLQPLDSCCQIQKEENDDEQNSDLTKLNSLKRKQEALKKQETEKQKLFELNKQQCYKIGSWKFYNSTDDSFEQEQFDKPQFDKLTLTNSIIFEPEQQKEQKTVLQMQKKQAAGLNMDSFKKLTFLGQGNYGKIYMVAHKQTNFICALKIINKKKVREDKYEEQIVCELGIHMGLNHPNIAPMYGCFDDQDNIYLLMELCTGGSIYGDLRRQEEFKMSEDKTLKYIDEISMGIQYLHRRNIIHRDIKPENVIINFGIPKLCDFGWAINIDSSKLIRQRSGSPLYYPPEIVQDHQQDKGVDIWCLGMLLYECLVGKTPFSIYTENQLHRIVQDQVKIPDYVTVSPSTTKLIMRMLEKYPIVRPSIQQIRKLFIINEQQKSDNLGNLDLAMIVWKLLQI